MHFTIYSANCTGNAANCSYPNRREIGSPEQLRQAVTTDHVCAAFRNNYRSIENFLSSDVLVMDLDNDHTADPSGFITEEKMAELFPDIDYCLVPSRHHNLKKGSRPAAPRYHVFFPMEECTDAAAYAGMKAQLQQAYPFFDDNALDAARFLFGSDVREVVWHEGGKSITDLLADGIFLSYSASGDPADESEADPEPDFDGSFSSGRIPEGSRNNTMHRFAAKILKRYGITDKAREVYLDHAAKCDPPLEEEELDSIWASACRFYTTKVVASEDYIPPKDYNNDFPGSLKPQDYSDIGQAKVLCREYGDELIYTSATDFLRYDGTVWIEDNQLAVAAAVEFLDLQLQDARDSLVAAEQKLLQAGVSEETIAQGSKAISKSLVSPEMADAVAAWEAAAKYFGFVMKRRDMKFIASAMNVSKALLNRNINDMDRDPNLLNTPDGTIDLTKGMDGLQPHRAEDRITKITDCAPGDRGEQVWQDALNLFFCGDAELIRYVQRVVGLAAIGKVYQEHLVIAYGDGANGKSTFWNTIARVLGTYSGKISAEVLTVGTKRNVKPEMAELKGKRLIIASEMEEGMRLNTATVKQLCSTDPIQAEKKYEKPFSFVPTHTLVLYTNHLPRVGASDDGIWRRLIVIPFHAKITGKNDVKNYADRLFDEAGPAILRWIIEGAREAIELEYRWPLPAQVQEAIDEYRQQNDWFSAFLEECCEVGDDYEEKSGTFYDEYRNYCQRVGEYTRNSADFYAAVEKAGFRRKRAAAGRIIVGARLKSEFLT